MMRFAAALVLACILLCGGAHAREAWQRGQALPQDRPLPATLESIAREREHIQTIGVTVNLGLKQENPTWAMTRTVQDVFLARLLEEPEPATAADRITMRAKNPEPAYKGLTIHLTRLDGKKFEPFTIYNGRVSGPRGTLRPDNGRWLEYWSWGTARIRRELVMAARVMPVLTFEQCRLMGQAVVDTVPRQCLLPDGDVVLEMTEPLTDKALKSTDFESCLYNGVGLIHTFPRRCVAPGGRVFAEPPRIFEPPQDAPLAASGTASPTAAGTPLSGSSVVEEPTAPAQPAEPFVSATTVISAVSGTATATVTVPASPTTGAPATGTAK